MVKKLLGDAVREERLRRNLSQNSLILYMVFIFVQNTTSIFLLRIQSSLSDTPGSQTEPFHTALTPLSPFHYSSPVISILQCITKKYKNAMIMQFQTPKAAKPRGYGLCSPASTIQTRFRQPSICRKTSDFPAI